MRTREVVKGNHTRKTASFIRVRFFEVQLLSRLLTKDNRMVYHIYPCIILTPILDCTKKKKKETKNSGSGFEKIA